MISFVLSHCKQSHNKSGDVHWNKSSVQIHSQFQPQLLWGFKPPWTAQAGQREPEPWVTTLTHFGQTMNEYFGEGNGHQQASTDSDKLLKNNNL